MQKVQGLQGLAKFPTVSSDTKGWIPLPTAPMNTYGCLPGKLLFSGNGLDEILKRSLFF